MLFDGFMKKNIFIIVLLFVCGCTSSNNKYSDFEKFNLKDRDAKLYEYHSSSSTVDTYALADISVDRYGSAPEGFLTGFFYQIENGEYILLDEIESCGAENAHKYEKDNQFFGNELYVLRCTGGLLLGYSFNKEKINKRELHLDMTEITKDINDTIDIHNIEKITEDFIYVNGSFHSKLGQNILIECSKEDLKCTLSN